MIALRTSIRRFFRRPLAATIDLAAPAVARNPFPHYEELRRDGPVQYLARHDAWILLGHDEVAAAFAQPLTFSNRAYAEVDPVLLAADPPEHTHVRRIVSRHMSPDVVAHLIAFAEEHAPALLRPRMDAVADYAMPLSAAVAAQLLGFDADEVGRIRAARSSIGGVPNLAELLRVVDLVSDRARLYRRLTAEDGLGEAESRSVVRLLWLAATMTTERAIAHSVLRLLEKDQQLDPALVPLFVEEVLRLHPPELLVPRATAQAVELGGRRIPAGAAVLLCVAAANRDPARFERPAELRLDRPPARTFTFGSGVHHCLGSVLGRRVVHAAVRALLRRGVRGPQPMNVHDVVGWCSMTASPVAKLMIEVAA